MTKKTLALVALAAALTMSPALAQSDRDAQDIKPIDQIDGNEIGRLNCTVEGGWGMLIKSSRKADCEFVKVNGEVEVYAGELNKLGIDIGKSGEAYMTWVVFTAKDAKLEEHPLVGSYSGLSAEASLGIGLGANALVGSNFQNIGLQPIAVQGASGLNLAVGLATLELDLPAE